MSRPPTSARRTAIRRGVGALVIAALSLASLLVAGGTQAATDHSVDACRQRMASELTSVRDTYRSVLFGSAGGTDGQIYVKTGGTTDAERAGIFETKARLTSELVAPLVEAYRTLRCKSIAVCRTVAASAQESAVGPPQRVTIQVIGCAPEADVQLYPECSFGGQQGDPLSNGLADPAQMVSECADITQQTLAFERSALKLSVAYDSEYRSHSQMLGTFDWMLKGIPVSAFEPIRRMVNLLGKLSQIPCYVGQCDLPQTAAPSSLAP